MIELKRVYKIYKLGDSYIYALKNINLHISKGEFVAVMGPSGSGKSTLLHLIGCLDKPTKGDVIIMGKNTREMNDNELAELRKNKIGFVFQQYYLFPNLTAMENVEIPMIFSNISINKRREKAMELLKKVGLEHRAHHLPSKLSGGEQQRVAIARALANNPDIILADEPTGSLDAKSAEIVMDILKNLNEEGKTIIVVTHDPKVASYAERIILLLNGKIIADGISIDEALKLLKR